MPVERRLPRHYCQRRRLFAAFFCRLPTSVLRTKMMNGSAKNEAAAICVATKEISMEWLAVSH
jgi:hypothetical protein